MTPDFLKILDLYEKQGEEKEGILKKVEDLYEKQCQEQDAILKKVEDFTILIEDTNLANTENNFREKFDIFFAKNFNTDI